MVNPPLPPLPFDDIFVKLGLENLKPEEKERMRSDMQEIIENRVTLRILDIVPEPERETFSKLESGEDFTAFFEKHGINPVQISTEEAMKFREELIQDASYIQGAVEAKHSEA